MITRAAGRARGTARLNSVAKSLFGAPAAVCAVLAAVAVVGHWCGLLLIVDAHAVPGWALGGALLVAALTIRLAGRRARRYGQTRTGATTGFGRGRRALTTVASLTVVGCVLSGLADVPATYQVLRPAGPGGCRAVVRETAFLFAGGGDVYTGYVIGPIGVARRGSSWTADDGYRPVAAGTYRLSWGTGGGSLAVEGTDVDPVQPALHEVGCG